MTFKDRLNRLEATALATKTWPADFAALSDKRIKYLLEVRAKNLILTAPPEHEETIEKYALSLMNLGLMNLRERTKGRRFNKIAGSYATTAVELRDAVHEIANNMENENDTISGNN